MAKIAGIIKSDCFLVEAIYLLPHEQCNDECVYFSEIHCSYSFHRDDVFNCVTGVYYCIWIRQTQLHFRI